MMVTAIINKTVLKFLRFFFVRTKSDQYFIFLSSRRLEPKDIGIEDFITASATC